MESKQTNNQLVFVSIIDENYQYEIIGGIIRLNLEDAKYDETSDTYNFYLFNSPHRWKYLIGNRRTDWDEIYFKKSNISSTYLEACHNLIIEVLSR